MEEDDRLRQQATRNHAIKIKNPPLRTRQPSIPNPTPLVRSKENPWLKPLPQTILGGNHHQQYTIPTAPPIQIVIRRPKTLQTLVITTPSSPSQQQQQSSSPVAAAAGGGRGGGGGSGGYSDASPKPYRSKARVGSLRPTAEEAKAAAAAAVVTGRAAQREARPSLAAL